MKSSLLLLPPPLPQLNDEDCILPSKLQAALQQILEEREHILRQEEGDPPGGLYCTMMD